MEGRAGMFREVFDFGEPIDLDEISQSFRASTQFTLKASSLLHYDPNSANPDSVTA